jgi:predicted amidohydrolase
MMRAHLLQMDLVWEDRDANFRKVIAMLDDTEVARGDLVVLPELFDSGFSLSVDRTADAPPVGEGETRGFLSTLARERGLMIHGSWTGLAPDGERGLNIAALFGTDGSESYRYAKIHPFTFGREGERFDGGGEVVCVDLQDAGASQSLKTTPAVCYDLRFPELFRRGLDLGAELFIIGANWPRARQAHWRALNIARAIESQAWVLCVNRVGSDPHLDYAGGSMVIDPQGQVLAEAGERECVLSAAVSRGAVEEWRSIFPAWRDRAEVLR